ncbi:hypothetical protein R3P38DRAFT_3378659 [Favolaschia claudopus]|uniref:Uncharacterized protein n=1 Tax=Favolaschia claudopus TaxID=2862362 RepID=A0AAV9Z8E6_9AGAR
MKAESVQQEEKGKPLLDADYSKWIASSIISKNSSRGHPTDDVGVGHAFPDIERIMPDDAADERLARASRSETGIKQTAPAHPAHPFPRRSSTSQNVDDGDTTRWSAKVGWHVRLLARRRYSSSSLPTSPILPRTRMRYSTTSTSYRAVRAASPHRAQNHPAEYLSNAPTHTGLNLRTHCHDDNGDAFIYICAHTLLLAYLAPSPNAVTSISNAMPQRRKQTGDGRRLRVSYEPIHTATPASLSPSHNAVDSERGERRWGRRSEGQ